LKHTNGLLGRIPNWAHDEVARLVNDAGSFYKAWHYFAYSSVCENMSVRDTLVMRAFDSYYKKYEEVKDNV